MKNGLNVVTEFEDKYGDKRIIHKSKSGLQFARQRVTPALALNQTVGVLIGTRIREARQREGLSLAELCTKAGLASSTPKQRMYEIEKGVRREGIRLGTLYAIAAALGLEPHELLPSSDEVMRAAGVGYSRPAPALGVVRAAAE